MEWNTTLESFGSSLGIDGLAPDADGSCSLLFDGENEITFTHDEEDRAIFMYCEIGDAADLSRNACLALLEASLLGAETGGAALSVKAVTGKPIKFAGVGEKLDAIEVFHPDRMASRILGMGDVLTLIEKAEAAVDEKKAQELAEKLKKNRFTLTDYLDQLNSMKNMGSLQELAGMVPGLDAKALAGAKVDEKAMAHTEAIILSMTPAERENPSILNSSRKRRIAAGAGVGVVDINRLLKQFEMMQTMARQLSGKKMKRFQRGGGKMPFGF